jgi:hypothetical protein
MFDTPTDIGEEIVRYDGYDEDTVAALDVSRRRFLDKLWLPCPLSDLSTAQIEIVSRFREQLIDSDTQFTSALRARKAFLTALGAINAERLLEVGCGKFPLAGTLELVSYQGIEVDNEAIAFCQNQGLSVSHLEVSKPPSREIDAIVASYVFHFKIGSDLLEYLDLCARSDAILLFNIIADDTNSVLDLLTQLSNVWPYSRVVKEAAMPRREYWVVLARPGGADRAGRAVSSLVGFWKTA